MKALIYLAILSLTACGTAPGGDGDAALVDEQIQDDKTTEDEIQNAMLVQSDDKLPPCEKDGTLAFVKDTETFKSCADGDWVTVSIKGDKGDKGDKGEKGEAGEDAPALSATEWIDPITDRRWAVAVLANWTNAMTACSDRWELPSKDVLLAAANHGLFNGLATELAAGYEDAWSADVAIGGSTSYSVPVDANPALNTRPIAENIGVYCVEAE